MSALGLSSRYFRPPRARPSAWPFSDLPRCPLFGRFPGQSGRQAHAASSCAGGESAALAVLPFRSPHLRRRDGVASRIDWHPTEVHRRFLRLLRAEARRVAGGRRAGVEAA